MIEISLKASEAYRECGRKFKKEELEPYFLEKIIPEVLEKSKNKSVIISSDGKISIVKFEKGRLTGGLIKVIVDSNPECNIYADLTDAHAETVEVRFDLSKREITSFEVREPVQLYKSGNDVVIKSAARIDTNQLRSRADNIKQKVKSILDEPSNEWFEQVKEGKKFDFAIIDIGIDTRDNETIRNRCDIVPLDNIFRSKDKFGGASNIFAYKEKNHLIIGGVIKIEG